MYNLLIVDDEPLILEGLYQMVSEQFADKFLVYQANSAQEAIAVFKKFRIDLLMSDIRMPEMDGMKMAQIVEKEWPDCLTVFLTGHSEFEYARSALRGRAVDYVLKLDGDRAICQAIERAYQRLEREYDEKLRLLEMTESWKEALPLLRQECMKDMVMTEKWGGAFKEKLISKMKSAKITLDIEKTMMMGLVCMEPETDAMTTRRIQSILAENLKNGFQSCMASILNHTILLLAQSEDNRLERLKGFLEISLSMCERMGIHIPRIYLYARELEAEGLMEAFQTLSSKRFETEGERGVLLCGAEAFGGPYRWQKAGTIISLIQTEKISDSLLYGKAEDFTKTVEEIRKQTEEESPEQAITVYLTIASLLMQAVLNYLPGENTALSHIDLDRLANYNEHRGFQDACFYLEGIAEEYFSKREAMYTDADNTIVYRVRNYILDNLGEDLSATRLGEVAGLHPSYLSQVYKKVMNQSLRQYIIAMRLNAAKEMLKDPTVKIQTIAEKVGMNTASYFTHFFKKYMDVTPQEYRSQISGAGGEN